VCYGSMCQFPQSSRRDPGKKHHKKTPPQKPAINKTPQKNTSPKICQSSRREKNTSQKKDEKKKILPQKNIPPKKIPESRTPWKLECRLRDEEKKIPPQKITSPKTRKKNTSPKNIYFCRVRDKTLVSFCGRFLGRVKLRCFFWFFLNIFEYPKTHCNTLQHTATHCNTLQHTATHCNTVKDAMAESEEKTLFRPGRTPNRPEATLRSGSSGSRREWH